MDAMPTVPGQSTLWGYLLFQGLPYFLYANESQEGRGGCRERTGSFWLRSRRMVDMTMWHAVLDVISILYYHAYGLFIGAFGCRECFCRLIWTYWVIESILFILGCESGIFRLFLFFRTWISKHYYFCHANALLHPDFAQLLPMILMYIFFASTYFDVRRIYYRDQ